MSAALIGVGLTGWQLPDEWRLPVIVLGAAFGVVAMWAAWGPRERPAPASGGNTRSDVRVDVRGSGNTTTTAGRDIHVYHPPAPPPPTDDFRDAPHLLWSSVRLGKRTERHWELWVECSNVGKVALVRPDSWVRSTVEVVDAEPQEDRLGMTTTQVEETIGYEDFDTQGPIHPGTFTLRMQFKEARLIPGDRTVRWRVVYMDDDMVKGYITECSGVVRFVLGTGQIVGTPALDNTSRKERNDDYNAYMKDKTAPSTGPRRPPGP